MKYDYKLFKKTRQKHDVRAYFLIEVIRETFIFPAVVRKLSQPSEKKKKSQVTKA